MYGLGFCAVGPAGYSEDARARARAAAQGGKGYANGSQVRLPNYLRVFRRFTPPFNRTF